MSFQFAKTIQLTGGIYADNNTAAFVANANECSELVASARDFETWTLSSVANASGGNTVYSGGITNGVNNRYVGEKIQISGFATAANNGIFTIVSTTNSALTVNNASGVAETRTASAAIVIQATPILQTMDQNGYIHDAACRTVSLAGTNQNKMEGGISFPGPVNFGPAIPVFELAGGNIGELEITSSRVGGPVLILTNAGGFANSPNIAQSAHAITGSAALSQTCSFVSANTAGNTLIVVVGVGAVVNGSTVVLTITDSYGNIWHQDALSTNTGMSVAIYRTANPNVAGCRSGFSANTITATLSGSSAVATAIALQIYEVSGVVQLDTATPKTGSGTSTSPATSSFIQSLNVGQQLSICGVVGGTGASTLTAGTNWTLDSGSLSPTGGGVVTFGSEHQALGQFTLSSAATGTGGSTGTTTYTGNIIGGASNQYAGAWVVISGFTNATNNGMYRCTASTATTLTLDSPAGVAETASGLAVSQSFITSTTGTATISSAVWAAVLASYPLGQTRTNTLSWRGCNGPQPGQSCGTDMQYKEDPLGLGREEYVITLIGSGNPLYMGNALNSTYPGIALGGSNAYGASVIYLQRNVGGGDHIGRMEQSQTTDTWSTQQLTSGTATVNFQTAWRVAPLCWCNNPNQTGTALACSASASTTQLTLLSGSGSDTVNYLCLGNPL